MDKHHVLFDKASWTLRKEGIYVREQPSLKPAIDRDAHNELHRNCPPVPALGYYALRRVSRDFVPGSTPLRSMSNLTRSIEASSRHLNVHRIEKELAGLAVEAIDLQRPYIKEGLPNEATIIDLAA